MIKSALVEVPLELLVDSCIHTPQKVHISLALFPLWSFLSIFVQLSFRWLAIFQEVLVFENMIYFWVRLFIFVVKLLWRGAECWKESLDLLNVAEGALFKLVNGGNQDSPPNSEPSIVNRRFVLSYNCSITYPYSYTELFTGLINSRSNDFSLTFLLPYPRQYWLHEDLNRSKS